MKLFSPDSKFMRAMSQLADLALLNMAFLLCCVPIVTIGPAVEALNTVTFRMVRNEGGLVLPQFFRSFRENFRQALLLWLPLALALAVAGLDIWLFAAMPGVLRLLEIPFFLLLLLVLFTAGYAFPLQSQFDNTVKATLKNALILSLGYLPRTLLITALNIFPFSLLLLNFYLFLYTGFIWVFLYFSAASYLIAKLLEKVFASFRDENKEEQA